ncbi:MAG: hypothetical protein GC181_05610 [Bacteroidetes bacterium]|nr:hypothetical protein [Bacteroidota bacterium]
MWIYIITIALGVIGMIMSSQLKSRFRKYSQIPLSNHMSGREVAEKMLRDNGITDVQVISVSGELTDHYNPLKKTVNLSEAVYNQRNAAAAAVAAHECGHAVQHAKHYAWLNLRSSLVPIINITSPWLMWVLLFGILMINIFPALLLIGIGFFALTTLFSFITLPVEYDASRRALIWLQQYKVVNDNELAMSKDALKWAALTYVVSALGSLATLLYYVNVYMNRR